MTRQELEIKAKEFDSKLKRHPMSSEDLQRVLCDFVEEMSQQPVSGSLKHIPIFQYNSAVEAHKNTLDLLRIVQDDKKELKAELEAAYKEIDRLRGIINYR